MSTVESARGTVEIGFIAARTRSGSPLVMPPSRPPARLVERSTPSGPGFISSWAALPRRRAVSNPSPTSTPLIAWMPMSAPASRESSRSAPLTNEPRPTGRPSTITSTTPPRVSPSFFAASISAIIAASASLSYARTGLSSMASMSVALGAMPAGAAAVPMDTTCEITSTPSGLAQELPGNGADGDAGRGLAGAGAFEHVAGVVEAVLEHAGVIGVTRAGAGERCVAGEVGEFCRVDRVGGHDRLPLGPLGVTDLDRDRATHRPAVPHTADDRDLVGFELHPGAAAVAEAAAGELRGDIVRRHLDAGHHPLEHGDEGGTMGFSGSYPTQHVLNVPMSGVGGW